MITWLLRFDAVRTQIINKANLKTQSGFEKYQQVCSARSKVNHSIWEKRKGDYCQQYQHTR